MTDKPANGLYEPRFEHGSCGFGLIANVDDLPSHWVVKPKAADLSSLIESLRQAA